MVERMIHDRQNLRHNITEMALNPDFVDQSGIAEEGEEVKEEHSEEESNWKEVEMISSKPIQSRVMELRVLPFSRRLRKLRIRAY